MNLSYVAELPTTGSTDAKFKIKGGFESVMFRNKRKLLKTTQTEELSVLTNSESCTVQLGS